MVETIVLNDDFQAVIGKQAAEVERLKQALQDSALAYHLATCDASGFVGCQHFQCAAARKALGYPHA